jgi:quercetin dioxygenase-like cupin family protein
MRSHRLALLLLATLPAVVLAQRDAHLRWGAPPPVFPRGARMAVVSGDPNKSGPFTVQLRMPDGYRIAPHFHPTDEHVAVKSGTFLVGMGDRVDRKSMQRLTAGQTADVKANMHHYARAKGPTTIEVTANGPFAMTYVNPADDPQTKTRTKAE